MIKTAETYNPMYTDKDHFVILVTGGRGSGKSYASSAFIERLTFDLGKDEGGERVNHQILYCRYTMVSAAVSVIPEFLEKIELDGTDKYFKANRTDVMNRSTGARIMFRGIKTSSGNQTAKLKSIHGLTTFVCDEAEEWTDEQDFERIMLSIRQKGIQNRIIIIMNPTDSNHFIYQKYIKDTHKIVEFDGVPVQISTHPNVLHIHTSYLDNVKHLSDEFLKEIRQMKETNPEKYAHVVMGQWADVAEGAVYKKWTLCKEFPENAKKVAIGLDFGYSQDSTAAVRCGIVDNDLYIDELFYQTGMLSTDIARELRKWKGLFVYADSADPRLIDELILSGLIVYPVQKYPGSILAGIQRIHDFDNIFVTERSYNVQDELRNYVWAKDKNGNYINQPEDKYNHCFVGETKVTTSEGEKRIDEIKVGDMVLTSQGYKRVLRVFDNGIKEVVNTKLTIDGEEIELTATADHKIKTDEQWTELQNLKKGTTIYQCRYSTERNTDFTMAKDTIRGAQSECTSQFGNTTTDECQKVTTSTTRTKTRPTTLSRILNYCRLKSICRNTSRNSMQTPNIESEQADTLKKYKNLQPNGINPKMAENGTATTENKSRLTFIQLLKNVCGAARNIKLCQLGRANSAQTTARQDSDTITDWTMRREYASVAGNHSQQTSIQQQSIVQEVAVAKAVQPKELQRVSIKKMTPQQVYDIEVEDAHEYFANGILVHNCMDAVRYYTLASVLGKVIIKEKISGGQPTQTQRNSKPINTNWL